MFLYLFCSNVTSVKADVGELSRAFGDLSVGGVPMVVDPGDPEAMDTT